MGTRLDQYNSSNYCANPKSIPTNALYLRPLPMVLEYYTPKPLVRGMKTLPYTYVTSTKFLLVSKVTKKSLEVFLRVGEGNRGTKKG